MSLSHSSSLATSGTIPVPTRFEFGTELSHSHHRTDSRSVTVDVEGPRSRCQGGCDGVAMKVEDDYLQLHGNLPPGTGFLPPETGGGRKRLRDDISAQRLEIGDRPARKMAAKTAFVLEGSNTRVSEDWVVGAPGLEPGTR